MAPTTQRRPVSKDLGLPWRPRKLSDRQAAIIRSVQSAGVQVIAQALGLNHATVRDARKRRGAYAQSLPHIHDDPAVEAALQERFANAVQAADRLVTRHEGAADQLVPRLEGAYTIECRGAIDLQARRADPVNRPMFSVWTSPRGNRIDPAQAGYTELPNLSLIHI